MRQDPAESDWIAAPAAATPDFHVEQVLDFARRHWKLAILLALLGASLGLAHFLTTPKLFRASTTVQIERGSPMSYGTDVSWLFFYLTADYYPTQYRLLSSRGMGERVVKRLRLYEDPEFNPGWKPPHTPFSPEDLPANVSSRLGQRLVAGLSVSPERGTQLVTISYRSSSPRLAAYIANGVVDEYKIWIAEKGSETVVKASSFISGYIESLKGEIKTSEERLRQFTEIKDDAAIDPSADITLRRLQKLNADYLQAVSDRFEKEAAYNEVLGTSREALAESVSGPLLDTLRTQQAALEQEYTAKLEIFKPEWPEMIELKERIDDGRERISEAVDAAAEAERSRRRGAYQAATRRERRLADEIDRVKEEVNKLNSEAVEHSTLTMELETRRSLLDNLLRQQSQTQVAARIQSDSESNVRVVDRALVPGSAYYPSLRSDLTTGFGLGIGLAIALAFLIDYMDRSIKTGEEAERRLALPVLGVIPDTSSRTAGYGKTGLYYLGYGYGYGYGSRSSSGGKRRRKADVVEAADVASIELLPQRKPRHFISEAYRSLRTALLLSSAEQLRTVGITSAQSGEGKTTTSINLAAVLAQLGHRVLLIDGDLRKPRLHQVFGVSNRSGLVGYLTAPTDAPAVQKTDLAGLFVLPSGPIPPNPSELLASQRMRHLIESASERFSFVIIDTPPVLPVSDAVVVGSIVDGMILCLQAGKVLREEATSATDRLRLGEVRILGLVLNRFLPRNRGKGKRHYYYYQAYGDTDSELPADSAA